MRDLNDSFRSAKCAMPLLHLYPRHYDSIDAGPCWPVKVGIGSGVRARASSTSGLQRGPKPTFSPARRQWRGRPTYVQQARSVSFVPISVIVKR
jgi:hypothetical protein